MPKRSDRKQEPKAEPKAPAKPKQSFGRWAWDWLKSLGAGFALFLVIRAFILQTWVITSGSMQNTLLVGDLLVLNKVAYGAQIPGTKSRLPGYTNPKRGDVVVFRAHHQDLDVIKRIIGLPGDTLQMRDKTLYLNGKAQTEPYVQWSDPKGETDGTDPSMLWQRQYVLGDSAARTQYVPTRDQWGPLVVPAGHFFMMGDNRDDSLDSRFWGFLDQQRVKGRAEVVYFSYDRDAQEPFAWIRDVRVNRILSRIK
jgi:signal peptidase I